MSIANIQPDWINFRCNSTSKGCSDAALFYWVKEKHRGHMGLREALPANPNQSRF
jgi:hypothetical protein